MVPSWRKWIIRGTSLEAISSQACLCVPLSLCFMATITYSCFCDVWSQLGTAVGQPTMHLRNEEVFPLTPSPTCLSHVFAVSQHPWSCIWRLRFFSIMVSVAQDKGLPLPFPSLLSSLLVSCGSCPFLCV